MGTKNKAVTAYLPADIEARLAAYCLEQGLSRQGKKSGKEKPALGTGIVEVLRCFFGTETNGKGIKTEVDQKAIEAIITDKLPSNVPTEAWVKTEIQQAIATLRSELTSGNGNGTVQEVLADSNGKTKTTDQAIAPAETTTVQPEAKQETTDLSMNQADLSRRLGSNPSTLSRHANKGASHFAQWSKAKDPDRLPWKFTEVKDKSKFFAPIQ